MINWAYERDTGKRQDKADGLVWLKNHGVKYQLPNNHKHPVEKPSGDDWLMGDEHGTWVEVNGEWVDIRVVIEFYRGRHTPPHDVEELYGKCRWMR